MIHPLTIVTFAAFFGAGFYVFQTKEEVVKLDRELRDIRRQTEAERGRTQTLSAEWARLNDQDRLRAMAASHLRHMQPMEPTQFQRLDDAQRRMPQAVAFTALPTGFQQRADAPSAPGEVLVFNMANMMRAPVAAPLAATALVEAPAEPVAAIARPVALASQPVITQVSAAQPALVQAAAAQTPTVQAAAAQPVVAAPRASEPAARPAPRPRPEVAALPPIAGPAARPAAPIVQAAAPPMRTALHAQATPMGGSLLGGGSSLPPPVPFSR